MWRILYERRNPTLREGLGPSKRRSCAACASRRAQKVAVIFSVKGFSPLAAHLSPKSRFNNKCRAVLSRTSEKRAYLQVCAKKAQHEQRKKLGLSVASGVHAWFLAKRLDWAVPWLILLFVTFSGRYSGARASAICLRLDYAANLKANI